MAPRTEAAASWRANSGDVSFSAVQRMWRKHGVHLHRLDTHRVSSDPALETKAVGHQRSSTSFSVLLPEQQIIMT